MFNKVLIANRGEIALRVIRACKELGVSTVVVHSTEDADTLPVRMADESLCIGGPRPAESYLLKDRILAAALATRSDAIHPGYGLLAENAEFARMCIDNGIAFVGPSPDCIELMGDKNRARETAKAFGVPVVPGSEGLIDSVDEALAFADSVGYPVVIKASAGGGGRGMREVHSAQDMESQFMAAKAEADVAFGNGDVYVEKLIVGPRHVEVQVLGDAEGRCISLCERDCSVQRRHQKLLEEAPCAVLTEELRRRMCNSAVRLAKAVGYRNAGTVEFLLGDDGQFYFMEMNTRLQVEHPVSELITGADIVKEQLRVAAGEPSLCASRSSFSPYGHALEFRINAEDPDNGFAPSPGKIEKLILPGGPGVRVDTYLEEGGRISPFYDSLVAKITVWGQDRQEAIARATRALDECVIEGVKTTLSFHRGMLKDDAFLLGDIRTDYIDKSNHSMG